MNAEINLIVGKISEYSDKNLSKISEHDLNNVRFLISGYVDFLTTKIDVKEAQNILGEAQGNILHIAAKFGDAIQISRVLEFIKTNILKDFGKADDGKDMAYYINVRDTNFFAPMHYAAKNGWANVVTVLIENGAETTPKAASKDREWMPIHYAAKGGHLEVIKVFLANRVDKEVKTYFGLTPLLVAAEFGHLNLVQFLLESGAKKDVKTIAENHCMNCLHYAAVGGFADVAAALIQAGIDKEEKTASGLTALYFAVDGGHADVVKILLESGANHEIVTSSGHDILYLAAYKNKKESVRILLEWGVGNLELALKIAKVNKNKETEDKLLLYKKSVDDLFLSKKLSSALDSTLRSFTKDNLHESRINLDKGVVLNAYGFMNLEQEVGFFKKRRINLFQAAHKNNNDELSKALVVLEKIIILQKS